MERTVHTPTEETGIKTEALVVNMSDDLPFHLPCHLLDGLGREALLAEIGEVSAEVEELRAKLRIKEEWLLECRKRLAC